LRSHAGERDGRREGGGAVGAVRERALGAPRMASWTRLPPPPAPAPRGSAPNPPNSNTSPAAHNTNTNSNGGGGRRACLGERDVARVRDGQHVAAIPRERAAQLAPPADLAHLPRRARRRRDGKVTHLRLFLRMGAGGGARLGVAFELGKVAQEVAAREKDKTRYDGDTRWRDAGSLQE
jgi:hypothetical protein